MELGIKDLWKKAKTALNLGLILVSLNQGCISQKDTQNLKQPVAEATEISKEMPKRKLILDFQNPIENFEANSSLWFTANQIAGKGNDLLGIKCGLDENLLGRIALLSLDFYTDHITTITSHELSHIREGKESNIYSVKFELNSFDFTQNFPGRFKNTPTIEQDLREKIAGLNQNEYNSYILFKNNLDTLTFDNGITFLVTKFLDSYYNLSNRHKADEGDVKQYIALLNQKDINLSRKEYLAQTLIADLLSFYTYDSLSSIGNYLLTGERTTDVTPLNIGSTELTPPLINHYLTTNGSFYNITTVINPQGEHPLELSLGTDIDFIGDGNVDRLRFGGQYHQINLGKGKHAPKISPFVYCNFNKSFDPKGISLGTELAIPLTKSSYISIKADYDKNDILENRIKGKDNGFNITGNFTIDF